MRPALPALLRSRTFWGSALYAVGSILQEPRNPAVWAAAIGAVVAAVGVRSAALKSAPAAQPNALDYPPQASTI